VTAYVPLMAGKGVNAGLVAWWVKALTEPRLWPCRETRRRESSIRFMGVAAHTEARKRRANLVRQFPRRRDVAVAPSPVPRV
jgi:hypothetical protein